MENSVQTETTPGQIDPSTLSYKDRVSLVLEIRKRLQVDESSVSDDEIRMSVRCIRLNRSESGTKTSQKKSEPKKKISLSDF